MRLARALHSLAFALALAACGRPTEADCKKAIENIDKVTNRSSDVGEQAPAVRKCRGQATKRAVQCWTAAKTPEELEACEGSTKR